MAQPSSELRLFVAGVTASAPLLPLLPPGEAAEAEAGPEAVVAPPGAVGSAEEAVPGGGGTAPGAPGAKPGFGVEDTWVLKAMAARRGKMGRRAALPGRRQTDAACDAAIRRPLKRRPGRRPRVCSPRSVAWLTFGGWTDIVGSEMRCDSPEPPSGWCIRYNMN